MRVKVNSKYRYQPVGIDRYNPPYGVEIGILAEGDEVQVVNLPGCPKANTMKHCHVNVCLNGDWKFAGLVHCNSLIKYED